MGQSDMGDYGRQQEFGIAQAEVEAFAFTLEAVAMKLKEVAPLAASPDYSDWVRAREALLILKSRLADELAAFSMTVEQCRAPSK